MWKPGARSRPGPYPHEPHRAWGGLYLSAAPDVFRRMPDGEKTTDSDVIQTTLYGDQQTVPALLEQELWRTDIFQRLYFIRQLGFADKVFPDTVDDGNETTKPVVHSLGKPR